MAEKKDIITFENMFYKTESIPSTFHTMIRQLFLSSRACYIRCLKNILKKARDTYNNILCIRFQIMISEWGEARPI